MLENIIKSKRNVANLGYTHFIYATLRIKDETIV